MSNILLEERRGVTAILTLNRPGKRNSLTGELLRSLATAISRIDRDPDIRGVVITGNEESFSTGADLNEALATTKLQDVISFLDNFREANAAIERSRKPIVAAINGFCLTGGLEVALACDLRFAGDNAKFGITSARIGSVAGAGGTQRLARLVGPETAKDILFSAELFDAERAVKIGLASKVVPRGETVDAAVDRIESYAKQAPLSVWLSKTAVNVGLQMDLESSLAFEQLLTVAAFGTDDRTEGMSAFLEKRAAKFKGS